MLGEAPTVSKHGQSSLPLQILIYFSWHYVVFFFFINLCLFTYKGVLCRDLLERCALGFWP
jgi:hypothetical protein